MPGSFTPVPHQEQGIHKLIEFGNRTLTSVVGIAAILVILAVWRWAPQRRSLRLLSFLPLLGVVAQAVLGGVTVLTHLHPATVASHFLLSMLIVMLSALLVQRAGEGDAAPTPLVRGEVSLLARVTAGVGAVVLALGTVVTGSGPHSGDAAHPTRFGFDPRSVSWLHADAVMLFLGLVVAVLVAVRLTTAEAGAAPGLDGGARGHPGPGPGGLHAVLHRPARGGGRGAHARRLPAGGRADVRGPQPATPLTSPRPGVGPADRRG